MPFDAVDRGILDLLRGDARLSLRALARRLGVSTPTVGARVRNLESAGILLGYRADVAEEALGGRVVWVLAQAPGAASEAARDALAERPWAEEVHLLAGGWVLARLRLHDDGPGMQDVHRVLTALPGVASYEVHEALGSVRGAPRTLSDKAIRPRCHQCGRSTGPDALAATLGGRRHLFCCVVCRDAFRQRFQRTVARGDGARGDAPGRA